MKYGRKVKYIFYRYFAWLKHFTCHLVPVLASSYKQHILSPAEVRKICYSLAELYVRSVYLDFSGGGGATFMKLRTGWLKL
jgi:hypothetical protein